MKTFLLYLILVTAILWTNKTVGQCNFSDQTAPVLSGIVIDTAHCPSAGRITINSVSGGGGIYVYELVFGPVTRIIQSQSIFDALPVGQYILRVGGCNGRFTDTILYVPGSYIPLGFYGTWPSSVTKISGLNCGITNNGVYRISPPNNPGGKPPYRYQIQPGNTNNFNAVPFEPGFDSVSFTGLNANSVYSVRVSDACNNFTTFQFTTVQTTPITPISVPRLVITNTYPYKCYPYGQLNFTIQDSATSTPYAPSNTLSNKIFWGNRTSPYLRVQISNAVTNVVYSNRHLLLNSFPAGANTNYVWATGDLINGETGLLANAGTGPSFTSSFATNSLPVVTTTVNSAGPDFGIPANEPLKIEVFFPGGDHCGTTVPPYTQTYNTIIPSNDNPAPQISSLTSNCSFGNTTFIRVFSTTAFYGKMTLVSLSPTYRVVKTIPAPPSIYQFFNGPANFFDTSLVVGNPYRVIIEDACGRMDSMSTIFTPAAGVQPPPPLSAITITKHTCTSGANDSINYIQINPLPVGYSFMGASITGVSSGVTQIYNISTGTTSYRFTTALPPGTYTYTVNWARGCYPSQTSATITINPAAAPQVRHGIRLTQINIAPTCTLPGETRIQLDGYVTNVNTTYTIGNVRLIGVPNNGVFPLIDHYYAFHGYYSPTITTNNSDLSFETSAPDSVYIQNDAFDRVGLVLRPGQEGTYTFAIDLVCADGVTPYMTLTRSITVTNIMRLSPVDPELNAASALICDGNGNMRINMTPFGGRAPFHFEYKLESASAYTASANGGLDSIVNITPVPAPGTVYDIRVTDACGNSAVSKVSTANFTGNFYINAIPLDCNSYPGGLVLRTSSVKGAHYTWRRNGVVIKQGIDSSEILATGITSDYFTVDVNIFGCYFRTASRTVVFDNSICSFALLPVHLKDFKAIRHNKKTARLSWTASDNDLVQQFDVEKSFDGVSFKKIGTVSGSRTRAEQQYGFVDEEYNNKTSYYRLRIVQSNGNKNLSPIAVVKSMNEITGIDLKLFPVPATNELTLSMDLTEIGPYLIIITDAQGLKVKSFSAVASRFQEQQKMDITSLSNGVYFLTVMINGHYSNMMKFTKN